MRFYFFNIFLAVRIANKRSISMKLVNILKSAFELNIIDVLDSRNRSTIRFFIRFEPEVEHSHDEILLSKNLKKLSKSSMNAVNGKFFRRETASKRTKKRFSLLKCVSEHFYKPAYSYDSTKLEEAMHYFCTI